METNNYDFLSRLRNGEKVDDIAKELTENLNKANKTHIQEEEAKRASEDSSKLACASALLENLHNLLVAMGESELAQELSEFEADELLTIFERFIPVFKAAQTFSKAMEGIDLVKKKDSSDPLMDFLDKYIN